MKETSEQKLAYGLRNRDRTAMQEAYGLYSGYLYALCSRYIPDKDTAKDILQDSFVKIFSSADSFRYRGEGSLKAWMSRITVNEALKHLRKNVRKEIAVDTARLPDTPDDNDENPDTEDIPAAVIHDMIGKLPDGYRTIFNLYVFEDKSHKEIAGLLGIKENSSASQLHRAKAMLARWIEEYRKNHGREMEK